MLDQEARASPPRGLTVALGLGLLAVAPVLLLLLSSSAAGSGWFRWFDTALAGYLFGVVFFALNTALN